MKRFSLLLAVVFFAGCNSGDDKDKEVVLANATIPVSLTGVERVVRSEAIITAGIVASLEEARLSFKTGGIIERVLVREGQQVQAGQLLATLNMTEIQSQVSQAELAFEKSRRDFDRVKNMLRDSAATLEQFENAQTGFDVASQNLSVAQFNKDFSKIVSPVSGTVVKKVMNEGEVTGPGSVVLIVVSNRRNDWVVKVGVSDRDWARIKQGDAAEIQLDAYPEDALSGVVSFLSQVADPATHLYDVEIRLTGNIPRMASGLFAKVRLIPSQSRTYSMIPAEALLEGHGADGFVFVEDNGVARKVPVKIGYLHQDKVLITSGLESTEKVISGGSAFLVDGALVHIP